MIIRVSIASTMIHPKPFGVIWFPFFETGWYTSWPFIADISIIFGEFIENIFQVKRYNVPHAYFSYPSQLNTKAAFTCSRRSSQFTSGTVCIIGGGQSHADIAPWLLTSWCPPPEEEEKTRNQYASANKPKIIPTSTLLRWYHRRLLPDAAYL